MGESPGLRRSRENRWIAGVCGGIAERFGWPPNTVRLLYVVASLVSSAFPGTLFYLLLWLCVPEEDRALRGDEDAYAHRDDDVEASHLSRSVALGLAAFLGMLGVHRFYAGRVISGLAMLFTAGGLGVWWLIDVVLVAAGEFRDFEGRRLLFWEAEDPDDDAFYDAYVVQQAESARLGQASQSTLADTP